ncbi:MAG: ABC transporter permease [Solobacterium sp.]|nr:ABC transporter permease [Solobacterium sp.]
MEQKTSVFQKIWFWLIIAFFYLPIIYVVFFSFNKSKSLTKFTGFSLRWYQRMFESRPILEAIGYTVACAVIATVVSTIVGTITAIGLSKCRRVLRETINQVNNLPMLNPDIVTAIGFMLFFTSLRIQTSFWTMVLAHIAFCIPYVILSVTPKLRSLDPNMPEAAMDLGCTPMQALTKVIVPQIMPGIISGALVAFSMSFDDFVISLFTTGPGVTNISIYVYGNVKRVNPTINALSAILVFVITTILIIVNVVPMIKERRAARNVTASELESSIR